MQITTFRVRQGKRKERIISGREVRETGEPKELSSRKLREGKQTEEGRGQRPEAHDVEGRHCVWVLRKGSLQTSDTTNALGCWGWDVNCSEY